MSKSAHCHSHTHTESPGEDHSCKATDRKLSTKVCAEVVAAFIREHFPDIAVELVDGIFRLSVGEKETFEVDASTLSFMNVVESTGAESSETVKRLESIFSKIRLAVSPL